MEKAIKIFTGILIIVLAVLSFTDRKIFNNEDDVKTLIDARKVIINDADDKLIDNLNKTFIDKIRTNDEKLAKSLNSLGLEDGKDKEFMTVIDVKNKDLEESNSKNLEALKDSKNKVVFEYEKTKLKSIPNIWLIILIILSAGLIGGWARTNYANLPDLKDNIEELVNKMKAILKEIGESKVPVQNEGMGNKASVNIAAVEQNTDELAKRIKDVIDKVPDDNKRLNTSLVFGVIASSIAILALRLTESQVLDFDNTIDYFVLWAWCLLGAVYAKDSLERVYNNRFPKRP